MRLIPVQKRNALDRKGFTLIELLVVITIIVILMALTLGVISKVYSFLDETKTVADVNRLAQGCGQFKSIFGRYPPARIILCEDGATYSTLPGVQAQLGTYSAEYLSAIFPGINLRGIEFPVGSGIFYGWDWTGRFVSAPPVINGVPTPGCTPPGSTAAYSLEGEECLVFFLGGVRPSQGGTIGFNTDKTRPTLVSTGARLGPYFEFDASRLAASQNSLSGGFFQVYRDVYGTPYAYFLARTPGMNNYFHPGAAQLITNPITGMPYTVAEKQFMSDCYSLTGNYAPLWQQLVTGTGIKYFKSDTFQIVSAGKDKQFGCGGLWNQTDPEQSTFGYMNLPANAIDPATPPTDKQATYDNITSVTNGRVVPK